jgi:GDPmannose 4,6-dehydratase
MYKTAIITGVSGQDGAYLIKHLNKFNIKCIGIVRKDPFKYYPIGLSYLGLKSKVKLINCNLLSSIEVNELLSNIKPDLFFNLAAQSSVGKSFNSPFETLNFNNNSLLNILEAIRVFSPKTRFYQASSSEIYGNISGSDLPVTEQTLTNPISPYGVSKDFGYKCVKLYREAYGLYCVSGILFNHESCLRKDGFVINKAINHAISQSRGLKSKLILGDINVVRDWGYAPKYVEAIFLMLNQETPTDLIISSGFSISLKGFLTNIYSSLKLDIDDFIEIDESLFRINELNAIYGSPELAKNNLKWEYNLSNEQLANNLVEDFIDFNNWLERNEIQQ